MRRPRPHAVLFVFTVSVTDGVAFAGQTISNTANTTATATAANTTATSDEVGFTIAPAVVNTPPTITNIVDQRVYINSVLGPLAFTVGDAETPAAELALTAASSNMARVPTTTIALGGSGTNRTVTVTPTANMTGTATLTFTVSDGELSAYDAFVLTVEPYSVYLPLVVKP